MSTVKIWGPLSLVLWAFGGGHAAAADYTCVTPASVDGGVNSETLAQVSLQLFELAAVAENAAKGGVPVFLAWNPHHAAVIAKIDGGTTQLFEGVLTTIPTRAGQRLSLDLVESLGGASASLTLSQNLLVPGRGHCTRAGCDDVPFGESYTGTFVTDGESYALKCSTTLD